MQKRYYLQPLQVTTEKYRRSTKHHSDKGQNLMPQEMMGWQWHQLDHMQIICTSLLTASHYIIYTGQMLFLTRNQQCQSTETNIRMPVRIWVFVFRVCVGQGYWRSRRIYSGPGKPGKIKSDSKSNCEHWWRQEENKWKGYAWLANWSQVLSQRKFVIWLQKSGNLSWKSVGTLCFNSLANFIVIICFRYSWERSTIVDNGGCVWCLEI